MYQKAKKLTVSAHPHTVGQQIIERYKNNSDNYKTLLDEAADSKSFFIGMEDETLISYNNICDRLNNIFDLNVSESKKTANIQIFNNILDDCFDLKPTTYRVFVK